MKRSRGAFVSVLGLAAILGLAAVLRLSGRDWDRGRLLHPDERFLCMTVSAVGTPSSWTEYLDTARSPLNPHNRGHAFFVYGTLPLFAVRWLADAFSAESLPDIARLGRAASAVVDTLSVLLVFLLGRRLYGRAAAWLAALLYALCVLPIQHAHFFTTDTWATLFALAFLYAAVRASSRGGLIDHAAAGLPLGLALACKISLLPLAGVALLAAVLPALSAGGTASAPGTAPGTEKPMPGTERQPKGGSGRHKTRVMSILRSGVALGLCGLSAFVAFRIANPYAFAGPGFISGPNPKWIGNMLELSAMVDGRIHFPPALQWAGRARLGYPWWNMVLFGMGPALGIAAWAGWASEGVALCRPGRDRPERFLVWAWIPLLFLYLASRFSCSMRYLLPIYPPLILLAAAGLVRLANRAKRSPHLLPRVAAGLATAAVLTASAAWTAAFTSVYRRPHTRLAATRWMIENVPAGATIASEHWDDALPLPSEAEPRPFPDRFRAEMLPWYDDDTPEKLERVLDILDRSDAVVLSSRRLLDSIPRLPMRYPMTVRYYRALLDGRLGLRLAATFESLPALAGLRIDDRRAEEAFSVYDHPRVLVFRKTPGWSREGARAILGDGVDWSRIPRVSAAQASSWHDGFRLRPDAARRARESGTWSRRLDPHRGLFDRADLANRFPLLFWVLAIEILGLAAFPLVSLVFRSLPDRGWLIAKAAGLLLIGYGAWLTAALGQTTLRDHRPLALALAIASAALAWRRRRLLAAWWRARARLCLLETAGFWLVFAAFLALRAANPDLWHPWRGGEKPMDFAFLNAVLKSGTWPPYHPWAAGEFVNYYYFGFALMAAPIRLTGIVPSVAYNLAAPTCAALLAASAFTAAGALAAAFRPRGTGAARALRARVVAGLAGALLAVLAGNLLPVARAIRIPWPPGSHEWFWAPSRAIPVEPGAPAPITEFPFFTFLFGDLHAHAMAAPFLLFALAAAVEWMRRPGRRVLAALALATGALYPLNAWDYPTGLALTAAAIGLGQWFRRRGDPVGAIVRAAGLVAAVVVAGRLMFLPFHLGFHAPAAGFHLWGGPRTPAHTHVLVHGLFLLPIGAVAALAWLRRRDLADLGALRRWMWAAVVLLALALIALVEFATFGFDIGRMNTVFKFYFQTWLLLSVAAGAGLPLLLDSARATARAGRLARAIARAAVAGACLLWASSLFYAVRAVPARLRDRFDDSTGAGLDGARFLETARHTEEGRTFDLRADAGGIRWLQENVRGSPVVLEACQTQYRWGGRVSIHTGLPTVLGWPWHVLQQRGGLPGATVDERRADVQRLFTDPDAGETLALLAKYGVEYVYVGPLERILYGDAAREKFDAACGSWAGKAFGDGDVDIYAVGDRSRETARREGPCADDTR